MASQEGHSEVVSRLLGHKDIQVNLRMIVKLKCFVVSSIKFSNNDSFCFLIVGIVFDK